MKTPLELPYRYRIVLCVLLISLTSATQPPGKCKGLASVAQPPGKCLGSVALRPAISDGLPLSVTDVRIFDMLLGVA